MIGRVAAGVGIVLGVLVVLVGIATAAGVFPWN